MNKICTSIEQSKKLIELGIDVNTADMCWTNHYYGVMRSSMTIAAKTIDEYKSLLDRFNDSASTDVFIPAWSLSALLGLTPNDVSLLHLEDVYQAVYDVKPYYITNKFDNPFDAAFFEMIVWLKENNKI